MKKCAKAMWLVFKIFFIFFVVTFGVFMSNGENKLIYYMIRPLLNKHYDNQKRDRRV